MSDDVKIQKRKLNILTVVCLLLIAYFSVLTCRQIIFATPLYDDDYKTFYVSLRDPITVYADHYYVRVLGYSRKDEKNKSEITAHTTPTMNAVNMNTPAMNLILRSLVTVSDHIVANAIVWTLVSIGGAVIGFILLMECFEGLDIRYYAAAFLFLLFSWPSLSALKLGQVSYLIFPFFAIAFFYVTKKEWRLSAVFFGLLASLKLFFLIFFLFFVVRREWKLARLFFLSFFFFSCIPFFYFHSSIYIDFYHLTQNRPLFISHAAFPMNASFLGLTVHLKDLMKWHSGILYTELATLILCSYVVARWLVYDYFVLRFLPELRDELRVCFLMVMALLCSPLAWVYYFVFLAIPVVVFFKIAERYALTNVFFIFFTLALFLPFFAWMPPFNKYSWFLTVFSAVASLFCWLVCLCSVVNSVRYQRVSGRNNRIVLLSLLSAHVLTGIILLHMNYGMPYFLDLTKKSYIQHTMPAMAIPK